MKNPKAFTLILAFSKEEIKLLKKFLISPIYLTRSQVKDLGIYFIQITRVKTTNPFNYEKAHKVIFENEAFNKSRIVKLCSELYHVLEKFILILYNRERDFRKKADLIAWYNDKDLVEFYLEKLKEASHGKSEVEREMDILFDQYRIELQQSIFKTKNDTRTGDVNYIDAMSQLDLFYIIQKLSRLCLMLNRERAVNIKYDKPMMVELMSFLPNSEYIKNPNVACYFAALKMLSHPGEVEYYNTLKDLIDKNQAHISELVLREFFVYLENESLNLYKNVQEYYAALYDLYRRQVKARTIFYKGKMLHNVLKNVIVVAVRTNNIEWASHFLDKVKNTIIPSEHKDSMFHYCKAEIAFKQKKYEEVIGHLAEVNEEDVYLTLALKRFYIKVWFETKQWELLDAHINSYRVFLHRHLQIDEERKNRERLFANFTQKLHRFITNPNEQKFEGEEFLRENFPDKSWVQKQYELNG